tara:strand:- start:8258 stop:9226 length:969 start_codon:yes stop_codon:yes gene_type:complete
MLEKIKLNLFKLKSKNDLESIYRFFKKSTRKWFDKNQNPRKEFFHVRGCLLCKSKSSQEVYKIDGFTYHECLSCMSIYTKPHLREVVLDNLYSDGTYQVYQDKLVKKGKKIRKEILEERKYLQIKQFLSKKTPKLLDIGCGSGTFLDICKQNGWHVEGVDPSPTVKQTVFENYSIKVHQGDFNQMKFNKSFDVITLWGVLEHVADPIAMMKRVKASLKRNGMVIFEVPSANCFISEYLRKYNFSPTRYIESGRHNIFFSIEAIREISKNLELKIEYIETNGLDVQTILMKEFDNKITDKILNMQDVLNDLLLGDHYRVFLRN